MLILTDRASDVIRSISDRPDHLDTGGLRIAATTADGADGLSAAPVGGPEAGDQVIENNGARVFLDEAAAAQLDAQVLDAVVDQDNRVEFVLAEQG